ncbi:MAG: FxLYD domain-containing protein [Candidatus Bipolaricaulia bacterium]
MMVTKSVRSVAVPIVLTGLVLLVGCFGPIERPIADFTWCPDGTEGRLDYWFTSTSTTVPGATVDRLEWEFDDGSPPAQSYWDTVHRFGDEGIYRVTLTVKDSRGVSGTITKQVQVAMAAFIHSTWQLTLGYPPTVSGIVENGFTERLNQVVIRAKFYDADGVRLTDGRFEITDLDPGEQARFEVRATDFTTRIFHATVEVDSFAAECSPLWGVVPAK